jgi:hypothetical protein
VDELVNEEAHRGLEKEGRGTMPTGEARLLNRPASPAASSAIRPELQDALEAAQKLRREALPTFLGDLETVRATAWARLTVPVINEPLPDELLDIHEAARRLGASIGYVYHNHSKLPFTRHVGRNVRFSARGIENFIERRGFVGKPRRNDRLVRAPDH